VNLPLYPSDHAVIVSLRLEVSVVPVSSTCEVKHKLSEALVGAELVKEVGADTSAFPVVPDEAFVVGYE
jgi:hypothetical protein